MDQEKKACESNEITTDFESLDVGSDAKAIVPDDAFAQNDTEEKRIEEMLPQSLSENEEDFLLDKDELFTDEEIASIKNQGISAIAENGENAVADGDDAECSENHAQDASTAKGKLPKTRKIESVYDAIEMFVFALAFVLIAMAFFFRHSVVDGSSMENTLLNGEHLIISDLFYTPKTGDIVVVQDVSKADMYPELAHPIVKRVIATEGQTLCIYENGDVYVDGSLLPEKYVYIDQGAENVYHDFPLGTTITIPENTVFLMGDHRNISLDSRRAGTFKEEAILGKVILRFLPFDRFNVFK